MHKYFLYLLFLGLITSCQDNSVSITKEQVMSIAEKYVRGQLANSERQISVKGTVTISEGDKKYYIDPLTIFTGLINEDSREDALITIVSYNGMQLGLIEHLFIILTDEGLSMQKSFESDMKILDLKDRIITAELPTHPRSSPLYNCSDCREIVRYRYDMGEMVKVE